MITFGHTLAEVQKFLVALIAFIIAGVGLFVTLDPGFQEGVETLIFAAIGVAAVFSIPHPTQDQVYKAFSALVTAGISVIQFYHTVPSSTTSKVIALAFAAAAVYAIWRTPNAQSSTPQQVADGPRRL